MRTIDFTTATTKRQRAERFALAQRYLRQALRGICDGNKRNGKL